MAMDDLQEGRKGPWMQTSLGGKFFPQDPRVEEIFISDIANGLAKEARYGGGGDIRKHYSVAEHCVHLARYARKDGKGAAVCLAVLLHDAAEGYIKDLPRAIKLAAGGPYKQLETNIQWAIHTKYGLLDVAWAWRDYIKELDQRIVKSEKPAIMRYSQPWAYDTFEPLPDVFIYCWQPLEAKEQFLLQFKYLARRLGLPDERIEL